MAAPPEGNLHALRQLTKLECIIFCHETAFNRRKDRSMRLPNVPRSRPLVLVVSIVLIIYLSVARFRQQHNASSLLPVKGSSSTEVAITAEQKPPPPEPSIKRPTPLRLPPREPAPEIVDNFPAAATAKSAKDLPPVPSYNKPPYFHKKQATPLMIGFTRNWRVLQQTVVSYIVAGWPPEDIYVVENTGTMLSNQHGLLSPENPFYINYERLTKVFGVHVITTPTLFTFAQLQNFFTWTALQHSWEHYFWAHMDTVAMSDESYRENGVYKSLYERAVDKLTETMNPEWGTLAALWFAYDYLTLVRTQSYVDTGGWDPLVPFYMTDCDMHERLWMRNYRIETAEVGLIWDVASTLPDLAQLFHRGPTPFAGVGSVESSRNPDPESHSLKELRDALHLLQVEKNDRDRDRNSWQAAQVGGQGEPFYRDPEGFERGLRSWMDHGRNVFAMKWGRNQCNLRDVGLKEADQWRMVDNWEDPKVRKEWFKGHPRTG